MIQIQPGNSPQSLAGPGSIGDLERAAAIAFFGLPANHGASYDDFKAYKSPDVVQALNQRFANKCAYCESVYAATAPVDVEHYRPKGGVEVDGKLRKPGYYWLAAEWTNLLPSCIDCNRKRTHEFPDAEPALRGKANKFPIANPTKRAANPGEEAAEQRLLLHPCLDKPEKHLEFIEEGAIRPALIRGRASEMGRLSIEVYGLDRPGLVHERQRLLIRMDGLMARIRRTLERIQRPGVDAQRRQELDEDLRLDVAELKTYEGADQPYAGMARQMISGFLREMRQP
jgi:uncharacterized protein (TIGR02646 family)